MNRLPHGAVEIAVVGAGPAGSATALLLARAGHEVVLLERACFPRGKPCGDCLSAGATPVLERLGVLAEVEAAAPARLLGWRVHAPSGRSFDGVFAPAAGRDPRLATALSLPRERLDAILALAARRAGACLLEGFRVTHVETDTPGGLRTLTGRTADGRPFRLAARLVIGADGLRSVVARRLGLIRRAPRLRKLSLTTHARGVVGPGPLGEMHLAPRACAGIAPLEDASDPLCNITLVVDADRFGAAAARGRADFFREMLGRFPALRGRTDDLCARAGPGPQLLASGPFDWAVRAAVAPGVALVGDAAGYYDPFTGQGIYQALAGAELLARDADAALRAAPGPPLLTGYERARRRLLRGRQLQHVIEAVLSRPWLAERAVARLHGAPDVANELVAVTGDLRPAGYLLRPALLLRFLAPRMPAEAHR